MTTTLTKTVFFKAKPETVWAFLTDKDKLGTWYHPAEADLQSGQNYSLLKVGEDGSKQPLIWGKVLQMVPHSKLVTSFCIQPFGDTDTTITWILEPAAGGTCLTLTHEGIAEAAGATPLPLLLALDQGWDQHFASLRSALNN